MIDLDLRIDQKELDRLLGMFQLSKEASRRAAQRAVQKTAKWCETNARRSVSKELRLAQKSIRGRLRLYRNDALEQKVWLGLNALAARRLGIPRRSGKGTRVGRHYFEGAFPIKKYGGGVYRRTGSERFPLELAKLNIDETGLSAMRSAAQQAEARLLEMMRRELNYELIKLNRSTS